MDIQRARELLSVLADGVNPLTGEILPEQDSCNQVEIVRALHSVLAALERADRKPRVQPENAGKPWTEAEEDKLLDEYDAELPMKQIAKEHGRTRGAIESRLIAMGLLKRTARK